MILVTGATGKIGRELVQMLVESGQQVRAVTRDLADAGFAPGVELVHADPSEPATMEAALQGVEAVFLNPAAMEDAAEELLALAKRQGVRRAVLISAITVEYGGGYERFAARFKATEDQVKASGLDWTFLRAADFDANALIWASQIRGAGAVRGAYAEAATASIHHRDIAAVGALSLIGEGHAGKAYALTGPAPLSQREKVRLIGQAIGRDVPFHEITPEQARAAMIAHGAPADVPDRMLGYQAACLETPGPSTKVVETRLGRPGIPFSQWAAENAAAFRA
ncbi:MAG: NmrA family transcriptional regulator [Sphingomonas bacterium]|uniref:NAD(P)H-binding protein n=1 Tax=Sphingomonas bacterium TaxID=1895847 RepID=UPI002634C943|nr:NAD(P)H-binding protein [Sphingomonas bacterium]MDB5708771.1 NmrA family transcriptional regulator [Sphingomonas bacterium]